MLPPFVFPLTLALLYSASSTAHVPDSALGPLGIEILLGGPVCNQMICDGQSLWGKSIEVDCGDVSKIAKWKVTLRASVSRSSSSDKYNAQ